jgi:hypothetical protein
MKSGYGIMMAEMTGFPLEMVAEARTLQRTVRSCFPLLLQSEGVDQSATSVAYYLKCLLLLNTSSLLGMIIHPNPTAQNPTPNPIPNPAPNPNSTSNFNED